MAIKFSVRHYVTRAELAVHVQTDVSPPLAMGDIIVHKPQAYRIEWFEHHNQSSGGIHLGCQTLAFCSLMPGEYSPKDTRSLGRYFYARALQHETHFLRNPNEHKHTIIALDAETWGHLESEFLRDYGVYHWLDGINAHLIRSMSGPKETPATLTLSSHELKELTHAPLYQP